MTIFRVVVLLVFGIRRSVALVSSTPSDASGSRQKGSMAVLSVPKLVVLDLDATLWLPELYTLRKPPTLGRDVKLLEDVPGLLRDMAATTRIAIASRTNRGEWARSLLAQVDVGGSTLDEVCASIQIFPGDKQTHLRKLTKATGVDFRDMIFFDDALGGRYGNCDRVAQCRNQV